MDVLQLAASSIFLALGTAFLISWTLYLTAIFERTGNQSIYRDNGFFLFAFLSIWYLALGFYFFYFDGMVKFIENHEYFRRFLILVCALFAGIYTYGFKHKFSFCYSKFESLYYWLSGPIELLKITIFKESSVEVYTLLRPIGALLSFAKALENFNSRTDSQPDHWLARLWKTIKVYILRIED